MKFKSIFIPILVFILTTVFLYFVGYTFHISGLKWFYEKHSQNGLLIEAGGSLVPIVIGVFLGFLTEYIIKKLDKKKET